MRAGQSLLHNPGYRRCLLVIAVMGAALLMLQVTVQRWIPHGINSFSERWVADASVDAVSLRLFRLSPTLRLKGLGLEISGDEPALSRGDVIVSISWWRLLTGKWLANRVSVNDGDVALVVDAEGHSNVSAMLDALLELSSNDGSDPPVSRVYVATVNIGYANQRMDQFGLFTLTGEANLDEVEEPTLFSVDGVVNGQAVTVAMDARFSGSDPLMAGSAAIQLQVEMAGMSLRAQVSTDRVESLLPLYADVQLSGDSLGELLNALNVIDGPLDGSTELAAVVRLVDDQLRLSVATVRIGRSAGDAEATITWGGGRPYVDVQLRAQTLFIDDFLLSVSGAEVPTSDQDVASAAADLKQRSGGKLLSENRLFVHDALAAVDGEIQLSAERFQQGGITITQFAMDGKLEAGVLKVNFASEDMAQGELKGGLAYSIDDDGMGSGSLRMDARRVRVDQIAADTLFLEVMPSGVLTLAVDLEFSGDSVAGLASSLDGGVYLFVEEGQLDEFAVELMGVDFLETARLLFIRDLQQIEISCGFIGLEANDGVLEFDPFIIDSDDTVFIAKGSIDLNAESLDLTLQSHARDTSWLTAATPVHVRGTLLAPKLRAGRKLYSRLAAAAALATVASPAAILLPFIELGKSVDTSECEARLSTLQ